MIFQCSVWSFQNKVSASQSVRSDPTLPDPSAAPYVNSTLHTIHTPELRRDVVQLTVAVTLYGAQNKPYFPANAKYNLAKSGYSPEEDEAFPLSKEAQEFFTNVKKTE